MADSCCEDKACEVAALRATQARVLWIVLSVNAIMFGIEMAAGVMARSTSLLADSLDMLGDALVYGFTLLVLDRSAQWQSRAVYAKGFVMLAFGAGVLAEAIHKMAFPALPAAETMGIVGALALAANAGCFVLLTRHRSDNLNMRSTWLCSRNDLIANVAVLGAAAATAMTASRWPDIAVGLAIAALFIRSAVSVLRDARLASLDRQALQVL